MLLHYKGVSNATDGLGRRHLLDRAKLPGRRYVYRHSTLDPRFLTASVRYGAATDAMVFANECEAVDAAMRTPKQRWPWGARK